MLHVTDDQTNMDLFDPYLVHRVIQLHANDRNPRSLHVYHEINSKISVNRPAHLVIKVISNAATPSQTQDKITGNSAISEAKSVMEWTWRGVVCRRKFSGLQSSK